MTLQSLKSAPLMPALLFSGIFLLVGTGLLFAWLPDVPDDGISLARAVYSQLTDVPDNKSCRLNYTVRTKMLAGSEAIESLVEISYLANSYKMHWISDKVRLYQDTSLAINVFPEERTIYITLSTPRELRERQASTAMTIRDSLFMKGEIVEYLTLDKGDASGSNRTLIIRPADNLRRFTMIDTVSIFMNSLDQSLQRIYLRYLPNVGIHSVDVEYQQLEFVDDIEALHAPVIEQVLNADGSLRNEYEGYQLIDMRQRKGG